MCFNKPKQGKTASKGRRWQGQQWRQIQHC